MDDVIDANTIALITGQSRSKRFIFISDLHFDCVRPEPPTREEFMQYLDKITKGESVPQEPDYEADNTYLEREDMFLHFVKKNFSNDILILAGDVYTDFRETLRFIRKMEDAKVTSYFILGNHDLSSNNRTEFDEIVNIFDSSTASHEFCKFLMTGKKYYHENVCIIGDTGCRPTSIATIASMGCFSNEHFEKSLYERESKKWIKFAKKILKEEKQVLIVTHFPQADFSRIRNFDSKHVCWEDAKLHLDANHCWKIFGHTHQRGLFQHYNNVCLQQGYRGRKAHSNHQVYNISDFGVLEKKETKIKQNFLAASSNLLAFYSPKIVEGKRNDLEAINEISGRGFKRAGHVDNKCSIAALITDKANYIKSVRKNMKSVEFTEYMGYALAKTVSLKAFNAIDSSIYVLENVSPRNARIFMTAVVITSYVFNDMIHSLDYMRPVDDYDIMRWFLLFATIQKYNLDPTEIRTVRKNENELLPFQNVPMYLPKVNDKSLTVAEVRMLLKETNLLETGWGRLIE